MTFFALEDYLLKQVQVTGEKRGLFYPMGTSAFSVFDFKLHKYYNYKQCLLVSLLPNMFVVWKGCLKNRKKN